MCDVYNRVMHALAKNLAEQLLDTVPEELAAKIQAYDWHQAQVVERGKDHVILIADDLAVARLPRRPDSDLVRKMRLLKELDLPWRVPAPLSAVDHGVLQSFIAGSAHPHRSGDPATLASLVATLETYDTTNMSLGQPFAQRGRITEPMLKRVDPFVENSAARAIAEHIHGWTDDGVGSGLVHGDLAGHNMHWVGEELVGILDWDYAARWDTALNATYLSLWHGVDLESITGAPHRARVWSGALGLYALADALSWDISPAGWRRLNTKVQPRIQAAYRSLTSAEA